MKKTAAVSTIALLMLVSLALLAQAPGTTPDQPFPNHEEPPNGWFCMPSDTEARTHTDAHACSCLGMTTDPMCGTKENPSTNDTAKCKVYCHKDHCNCTPLCHDTAARTTR